MRISKRMLDNTECMRPHPEPPWRITKIDIPERVQLFLPDNTPGKSAKEEWANNHTEFMAEVEDNLSYLLIYSDGSLSEKDGRRHTGFGVVGCNKGQEVFWASRALGKQVEVFNTEMAGLCTTVEEARKYMTDPQYKQKSDKIIFYADNATAIAKIFEGTQGKAQRHSEDQLVRY